MERISTRVKTRIRLMKQAAVVLTALNAGDRRLLLKLQQDMIDDGYDLTVTDSELVITTERGERIGAIKRP